MTNYYWRFISKYADIADPLYRLLPKECTFTWRTDQQLVFDSLKTLLTSKPISDYQPPAQTFILDKDQSNTSIGAVLSQIQEGVEKVIGYTSRRLSSAQEKDCVTRKELLAVFFFTEKFKHYLLGQRLLLRTDHSSLNWLYRFKSPQGQLARWLEQLSQFDILFQHRIRKDHCNAEALSRYPDTSHVCDKAGMDPLTLPWYGCQHCTHNGKN